MSAPTQDVEERVAVRVVLLDRDARILLFLGATEDGRRLWFTPGGGIDVGETAEQALRRELAAEVGPVEVALGPELWFRTHTFGFLGRSFRQRERYYLARTDAFEPGPEVADEHRRQRIDGFRWWSVDELDRCADLLAPRRLAALLRWVIEEGPPAEPFDSGV